MSKNTITMNIPEITEFDIESFKKGANTDPFSKINKSKPWDNARSDVIKQSMLRISDEYYMKLDYVSKKTNISKNKLCIDAIEKMLDERLNDEQN